MQGDECTPMCEAAKQGHLEVVETLLKHGASVDGKGERRKRVKSVDGWRMEEVVFHEDPRYEEEEEDDDNENREQGQGEQQEEKIGMADVDVPLFWAVRNGHAQIVEVLLDKGAKTRSIMMSMAVQSKNTHILEVFMRRGRTRGEIPLHLAALHGWVEGAKVIVDSSISLVGERCGGMTPLHYAVLGGSVEMVKRLVEWGASVEEVTDDGMSCTMLAMEQGHADVVRFLDEIVSNK